MGGTRKRWAVWVTVAAAVVFAAAFMPWGEVRATPSVAFGGPADEFFGSAPFRGMAVTSTVTGWNGTVTAAGVKVPNWTVVLLAAAVTAVAWAAATGAWRPPRLLGPALAALGLLQVVLTLAVLTSSGQSSVGIGILAAAAAFAAMAFASFALGAARASTAQ